MLAGLLALCARGSTTKETIARLRERIAAVTTAGRPVDVVVWRHPGETEDEAIERYLRQARPLTS
jgi:fatty acid-binding protein DegV